MSRLRSTRGAKSKAPARAGVYVQSPPSDIYVAMLGVSLGAMLLACLLLALILNQYGFSTQVS